eukprot:jgi/Bigna1/129965/aug1.10_g4673
MSEENESQTTQRAGLDEKTRKKVGVSWCSLLQCCLPPKESNGDDEVNDGVSLDGKMSATLQKNQTADSSFNLDFAALDLRGIVMIESKIKQAKSALMQHFLSLNFDECLDTIITDGVRLRGAKPVLFLIWLRYRAVHQDCQQSQNLHETLEQYSKTNKLRRSHVLNRCNDMMNVAANTVYVPLSVDYSGFCDIRKNKSLHTQIVLTSFCHTMKIEVLVTTANETDEWKIKQCRLCFNKYKPIDDAWGLLRDWDSAYVPLNANETQREEAMASCCTVIPSMMIPCNNKENDGVTYKYFAMETLTETVTRLIRRGILKHSL